MKDSCCIPNLLISLSSQVKGVQVLHHPFDITLKFKYGKYTILLFADPLTPFKNLIVELLAVLQDRYPNGLESLTSPDPIAIPSPDEADRVILGVAKDPFELSKGFEEISIENEGGDECPKSLSLKDGSVVAFAFVSGSGKVCHIVTIDLVNFAGDELSRDGCLWISAQNFQIH